MKIAIATVQVPFFTGGAEILVNLLKTQLQQRGHQAEIVSIPFKWYPTETLLNCMIMGRMMDLTEVNGEKIDVVVAVKFPAYYVKHPHKVIWLMHQHRQAYDLWGTKFGDIDKLPEGEFVRRTILEHDNLYLSEAKGIYTISMNGAGRLKKYNNIDAVSLYHPPLNHDKLHCREYENFIFYPSRIDRMKRQRVLVEAARYLKSETKIYLAGGGAQSELAYLNQLISRHHLEDRVKILGFISEEDKIDYYSRCLAVYFGAYDEDYGYITLEAFFSKKPVIVHLDAGGPLEFVEDLKNGFVLPEDPEQVAARIDLLAGDRDLAKAMGDNGRQSLIDKNINWDHVISNLIP
ncbi:MAG: glycosyltransferase family 4 protein [Deltaproteobacteria bacterium]|nr:glycosyltransferase family 4 protein [Deltaproteobacteria bacterium]